MSFTLICLCAGGGRAGRLASAPHARSFFAPVRAVSIVLSIVCLWRVAGPDCVCLRAQALCVCVIVNTELANHKATS